MNQPHRPVSEQPSERHIRAVVRLEEATLQSRTRADRMAWAITRVAGSEVGVLLHAAWFASWIAVNTGAVAGVAPFDPFPFDVLTMIVGLEVIFLSLVVLLNQNRMAIEADKRAHLNLQVDLLAERELTLVLRMQQELSRHMGLNSRFSQELDQLLKDTDVHDIAAKLDEALPD